jgi:acetylornithine/N-succinyldiaminopimelate aminotransferase
MRAAMDETTAAILVEPIQGEGGINPATAEYLQELRKIADEFGVLLIFDEVQCGMSRSGSLFAYSLANTEPDIMGLAKGIGGGFPLGACLVTKKVSVGMTPGTHGSTFGGNPLAMAVGNAVLDVILEKNFLSNVKQKGKYFDLGLNKIKDKYPKIIEEIRGVGLIKGLKMLVDNTEFVKKLINHKMLTVKAEENVVRLFPPLIVSNEELDEAIDKIEKTCKEMS